MEAIAQNSGLSPAELDDKVKARLDRFGPIDDQPKGGARHKDKH